MKNKIKKNIHRTLSVFMIVLLMLGVVPIVGVNAAEKVSDFEYSVLDDGTVEITRYIDDGSSDVIIPEVIEGKIVGDIDFCGVKDKCLYITPNPGGVGPMTIAMIIENLVKAYEMQK